MRSRNLKPGFFKNEQLAEMPVESRLLFAGLWCMADRAGRLEDRPKRIKIELFPGDAFDVDSLLNQLVGGGLIVRYEAGGVRCIQVLNFLKHQHPHQKEPPSTLPESGACPGLLYIEPSTSPVPAPDKPEASPGAARLIPSSLIPDSGSLIPESSPPESRKGRAKRAPSGHRLPEDWILNPERQDFARALGLDPVAEFHQFSDYWRGVPGSRGLKADWDATWRNSCRRSAHRPTPSPGRREDVSEMVARLRKQADDAGEPA